MPCIRMNKAKYIGKPLRSDFVVVNMDGAIAVMELLLHAYRYNAFLRPKVQRKVFGDIGYRFFVQYGDLFEADFLKRHAIPGVLKACPEFDWPDFQVVDVAPEGFDVAGSPEEREEMIDAIAAELASPSWQERIRRYCVEQHRLYLEMDSAQRAAYQAARTGQKDRVYSQAEEAQVRPPAPAPHLEQIRDLINEVVREALDEREGCPGADDHDAELEQFMRRYR